MKLRRITVAGFKTFASRAEVGFDRGITAIVGPNGSGKSNLVDALRWALGETNARELRGQRMDEVIYAGGGRRNRIGVAEVSVVIDNDEGRLPVEDPEVELSRRVVRAAGDTEYRINGERARLRDLEDLLEGTGLTQNGYAVVAQHDIDGIIEATPAQRRVLVEQAAGVRAIRAASDDARERIAGALRALQRVDDVLAEAEPRVLELAEQAALAREQRELSSRLAELRGSLAREAWRAARGRLRQAQRRQDQAALRLEAAREADRAYADRVVEAEQRLEAVRARHESALAGLETSRLAAERATGEARRWSDRLRMAALQRAAARRELHSAGEDQTALRTAIAGSQREEAPDTAPLVARREELAVQHAAQQSAARGAQEDASTAAGEVARVTADLVDVDRTLRELTVQLELFTSSTVAREQEVAATGATVHERTTEVAELERQAAEATHAHEAAEAALIDAQGQVERSWAAVNQADAEVAAAAGAAREALSALAQIRGVRLGALGGEGPVAQAVSEQRLDAVRLADCVAVRDPADAVAVAAAIEHVVGAWLVGDLEQAMGLLAPGGPREQLLDASLDSRIEAVPAPWRPVLDAVDVAPHAFGALSRLLEGIWLAADLSSARRAVGSGAAAAVLPDGRVVSATGVRGGDPGRALQLSEEERSANDLAAATAQRESVAIAAAQAAREHLTAAEQESAARAGAVRERAAAAATAAALAVSARRELGASRQQLEALRAALAEHATGEAAAAQRAGSLRARRAELEAEREAASRRHAQLQSVVESRRDELESTATALRELELELARLEAASGGAIRRWNELEAAAEAAARRERAASTRLLSAEIEALAALARGRAARQAAAAAARGVDEAAAGVDEAAAPLAEMERHVRALEAERAELAVALARAEDEQLAAAAEASAAASDVARLAEAAREEADDEAADWDPEAAEKAEREIVRLERRIAALGPVNALAPEQHDALAARVARLHAGSDDLRAAAADVQALAVHLTEEAERRFEFVFADVSQRFGEIFAELFPGGHAALRLEEARPDGEAEAPLPGVEILAQPYGKRLGPLRLLSGGERALTALATVLALQQVNPSPFYVFDEVDAALDDSNVLRFTRLLRRLAERQQFIVVTHNHITMAAADVLWGVTIDSDGVSSVLGVRFDADAHADALTGTALRPAG